MKLILLLAVVLVSVTGPCSTEYCNLSRGQRQQLIRLISQAASDDQDAGQQDHQQQLLPLLLPSAGEASNMEELYEARKRGLDLGMGRGFSGNQQGKSQVGLIAANMARGPGKRRRRSLNSE